MPFFLELLFVEGGLSKLLILSGFIPDFERGSRVSFSGASRPTHHLLIGVLGNAGEIHGRTWSKRAKRIRAVVIDEESLLETDARAVRERFGALPCNDPGETPNALELEIAVRPLAQREFCFPGIAQLDHGGEQIKRLVNMNVFAEPKRLLRNVNQITGQNRSGNRTLWRRNANRDIRGRHWTDTIHGINGNLVQAERPGRLTRAHDVEKDGKREGNYGNCDPAPLRTSDPAQEDKVEKAHEEKIGGHPRKQNKETWKMKVRRKTFHEPIFVVSVRPMQCKAEKTIPQLANLRGSVFAESESSEKIGEIR